MRLRPRLALIMGEPFKNSEINDDQFAELSKKGSELEAALVEEFGVTKDFLECGWVTRDGRLLDLSGRHCAGRLPGPGEPDHFAGRREIDHRELPITVDQIIATVTGDAVAARMSPSDTMCSVMAAAGLIRFSPTTGFSLSSTPTSIQLSAACVGAARHLDTVHFDIMDRFGVSLVSETVVDPVPMNLAKAVINAMPKHLRPRSTAAPSPR